MLQTLHCRCQMIIAQATLVCRMDMFHADNMRRVNGLIKILFSYPQPAISLLTYYGNICNRLTQTHAPMNIKQTSVIGANLNCHLRYMFAKYLMEWSIRPACTGIPAMYNALRYSLHVCYICYILDQNL